MWTLQAAQSVGSRTFERRYNNGMKRFSIAPQMREYDSIGIQWIPYTMFTQNSGYRSSVVNTDKFGFRYTGKCDPVSLESLQGSDEFSLIIGASMAFGVGASSDDETIAAHLRQMTGELFLNMAGRAFNSKQELILFLNHLEALKTVKRVVLVSGANNLYCSAFSSRLYDPMFFSDLYLQTMENSSLSKKRKVFGSTLRALGLSKLDWKRLHLKEFPKATFAFLKRSNKLNLVDNSERLDIDAAVRRTCADLDIWNILSKSMGFDLIYCLQPMPAWCGKILSPEEQALFDELNNDQNMILQRLDDEQVGLRYGNALANFCVENDLTFLNLNTSLKDIGEWIFVDRVHLTDTGYGYVAKDIFNTIGKSVQ